MFNCCNGPSGLHHVFFFPHGLRGCVVWAQLHSDWVPLPSGLLYPSCHARMRNLEHIVCRCGVCDNERLLFKADLLFRAWQGQNFSTFVRRIEPPNRRTLAIYLLVRLQATGATLSLACWSQRLFPEAPFAFSPSLFFPFFLFILL